MRDRFFSFFHFFHFFIFHFSSFFFFFIFDFFLFFHFSFFNFIFHFLHFFIFFIFSFFRFFFRFFLPGPPGPPQASPKTSFFTSKILILRHEERKNAPTETGPLPQSHAQDLLVIRVRGNPSLRYFLEIQGIQHLYWSSTRLRLRLTARSARTVFFF